MEHPLIAVVAPLAELNPLKYALRSEYRSAAGLRLGRRAKRIFAYQLFVAALVVAALVVAALVVAYPLPGSTAVAGA